MRELSNQASSDIAQVCGIAATGETTNITTTGGGANDSSAALESGVYRIFSNVDITISSGIVGTTAAATDMPMAANSPEYFYIKADHIVSIWDTGAGGGTVAITRLP